MMRWLTNCLRRRTGTAMSASEVAGIEGRVTVRTYSKADARHRWDDWDDLSRAERASRVRRLDADAVHTTTNVVVDVWLEHIVDLMDQSQTPSENTPVTHFAVGTDTTSPTITDTGLGNEVFRSTLDTEVDNDKDYDASGFIDTGEANGNTLEETALFTGSSGDGNAIMVNHATIASTDKTDQKLVTVDYTISYRDT